MKKAIQKSSLLAFATLAFCLSGTAFAFKAPDQLEQEHLGPLMEFSMMQHIKKQRLTPEISLNTLSNFVSTLDPSKCFLLRSDVDMIIGCRFKMLTAFKDKNWSFVTNIYQGVFMPSVRESCEYAKTYLSSTNFVPDLSRKVAIDAKKIGYPTNAAQRTSYLENSLHYQVAFMESMGEARSNAVKKVIKRRERILKYFEKQDYHEQLGLFMNAFCLALDPHSSYFPPEDMEDFSISMSLSLEGIGATLNQEDGYTRIEALTPGSPAEKCGKLKPGDKIIAIAQGKEGEFKGAEGEFLDVVDMELRDVVKKIRGKKDTTVRLKILRKTKKGQRTFVQELVRDKVKLEDQGPRMQIVDVTRTNALKEAKSLRIAVIDLPSFYLDTESRTLLGGYEHSAAADVRKLLESCQTQNVDGVILDFQRNGGGILDEAVNLAGLFLKKGNVVLTMNSRDEVTTMADSNSGLSYAGPLIVTTSSLTASAAEIVSGALKAYSRCLIVGQEQSFGKGSVQQVIPLTGRMGALKITKGLYFIANGISPQFDGVKSDLVVPANLDALPLGERLLPCALSTPRLASRLSLDSTSGKGVWKPVTTNEISRLAALSKKRMAASKSISEITAFIDKTAKEREEGFITIEKLLEDKDKDLDGEEEEELEEEEEQAKEISDQKEAETAEGEDEDADAEEAGSSGKETESGLTKAERELYKASKKQSSVTNSVLIQESLQIFGDWLMPDTVK